MNYLPRLIENTLLKYLKQFKVVLLTGARQVGKSTLLKHLLSDNYEYITLDDIIEYDLAKNDEVQFFQNHKTPLIIDEIQYSPNLFKRIKYLVDQQDTKGIYCLTGSQTYQLMKNVSESLAGRIGILELPPFSIRELQRINFNEPFLPTDSYFENRKSCLNTNIEIWEKIFRGSMPELINKDNDWHFFYNSYVKSYIQRDVKEIINIKNDNLFYKFLVALASRTGELLIPNDIARSIGISLQTVQAWISVLESSGLIYILKPYENNIFKRTIKTPKIYFLDTGLVCFLVGWTSPEVLKNGAMAGNIFETFVISEIYKSYKNIGIDVQNLYYYRDRDQKEIDLLIVKDNTIYPIEIKKSAQPSSTMAKNFPVLKDIPNMTMGQGCILCLAEKIVKYSEKLSIVPISYI
ncbi:MAG: ATP-binding protein [Bacteroidales bacterium]|nr:ATP-binding protein [Bacteroidales bacterium]